MDLELLSESSRKLYTEVISKYPRRDLTATEQLAVNVMRYRRSADAGVLAASVMESSIHSALEALDKGYTKTLLKLVYQRGVGWEKAILNLNTLFPYAAHYYEIYGQYPGDIQAQIDGIEREVILKVEEYLSSIKLLVEAMYIPPPLHSSYLVWTKSAPHLARLKTAGGEDDSLFYHNFGYGIKLPNVDQEMVDLWMDMHSLTNDELSYLRHYISDPLVKVVRWCGLYALTVTHPTNHHRYVFYPTMTGVRYDVDTIDSEQPLSAVG